MFEDLEAATSNNSKIYPKKTAEIPQIADLAQLVEHLSCKQKVTSSNLVVGSHTTEGVGE